MKRWPLLVLSVLIASIMIGCQGADIYIPGEYITEKEGYHSDIVVKVTLSTDRILDIEILSHEEPEILADIVFDDLPPRIMKKNGTDVEVVAGATYTSRSLIRAVEEVLEKAGAGK